MISLWVPGIPVPKGSAKAFMRKGMRFPVVIQDNADKQTPWASLISLYAQQAMAGKPMFAEGVHIVCVFYMPRAKSHLSPKTGQIRPTAPRQHVKKPDSDKLARLVGDALTGICYADDSQIVSWVIQKCYCANGLCSGLLGNYPGVKIRVEPAGAIGLVKMEI